MTKTLYQRLLEELGRQTIDGSDVPSSIVDNLNPRFPLRPYQERAFKLFVNYWQREFEGKPRSNHQLLFHMATGSGKTLIMAGLITYLYQQGYRNFLFFVNSTNIIDKTRANFLNEKSAKYLFADTITIGDRRVKVREVENFQSTNPDEISIVFSTIQGLHMTLNAPRENSMTDDDFYEQKVVLISDEAHHINTETKRGKQLGAEELGEQTSWEGTVTKIFAANRENVLMEFTATVDFSDKNLDAKYAPRLLFDYPLRAFREDGYSKEVKVIQTDLAPFERAIQGVLLSQYRRKVFEKHRQQIKPVILFKSRTIEDSQAFFDEFKERLRKLKSTALEQIAAMSTEPNILKAFAYLKASGVSLEAFIVELQEDFAEEKLISVNSKEESEAKQIAVNSLETNQFRAVFAVDKLNEGWDVLNLFDIVRLYDTKGSRVGAVSKTTMTEAQLIGRGARYCPFQITPDQPLFSRKYDLDLGNELRICEELFYHSAYNPQYVQDLHKALIETGLAPVDAVEQNLTLKESFKRTRLYQSGHIYVNTRKAVSRSGVHGLDPQITRKVYRVSLHTGYTKSSVAFAESEDEAGGIERSSRDYRLVDLGLATVRKALQRLNHYEFDKLKRAFPNLGSLTEFMTSNDYLGAIKLEISGPANQIDSLTPQQRLVAAERTLTAVAELIASKEIEYEGSRQFEPKPIKSILADKTLGFAIDTGGDQELGRSMAHSKGGYYLDLASRDWYVFNDCFGTSEEKLLIQYIDKRHKELAARYSGVYLIRNEQFFNLYTFDDGRAFAPDFILYLVGQSDAQTMHYQVFIEPKGAHLIKADEWKERFLESLRTDFEVQRLTGNSDFVVWGLPFYNHEQRMPEFEEAFNELLT